MIKKLKYKFILVTMSCILFIVTAILVTIVLVAAYRNKEKLYNRMEKVIETNGRSLNTSEASKRFGNKEEKTQGFQDRTIAVKLDSDGNIVKITGEYQNELAEDELSLLISNTLKMKRDRGIIEDFQFMKKEKNFGTILVLSDYSIESYMMTDLLKICLAVGILGLIFLFLLTIRLAGWIVKPVAEAMKQQKVFISNASHELRTPLTVIYANTELLEKQLKDNKWLGYIKGNAERMTHMVNDLLSLTRLDNSKFSMELKKFNISKAVLNTALSMEGLAFEKGKSMEINVKENIYYMGDIDKIQQLVVILLDNAIKYSDDNGRITLTLREVNRKPVLDIYNSGPGIPREHSGKIFDRFYRYDNSASLAKEGCGLGLSIARSIVNLHRGRILVESEEGKGAKFTVKL